MEPYTIEDIEMLRQKSGVSYQEAVALLDYHNGSLARALIDLEKHGRLNPEKDPEKEGNIKMNSKNNTAEKNNTRNKALTLLQKLYRSRVKIRKGDTSVCNVSVLFAGLSLLLAPHITIAGVVASMILGYQFSFTGMDPDFANDSLEKMVRSAAQNAKSSVTSVMQNIKTEEKKKEGQVPEIKQDTVETEETETVKENKDMFSEESLSLREQAKELEETMDSFFESNPASAGYQSAYSAAASNVPTIQIPVQTETRDGEVTTEEDQDGYASVTIG